MKTNQLQKHLETQPQWIKQLKQKSFELFDHPESKEIYKKNDLTIRVFRDDRERKLFVMKKDEKKNRWGVTQQDFYDFNEKQSVKELLSWKYLIDQEGNLPDYYLNQPQTVEFSLSDQKETQQDIENRVKLDLMNQNGSAVTGSSMQRILQWIKKQGESLGWDAFALKDFTCTQDPKEIKMWVQCLHRHVNMPEVDDEQWKHANRLAGKEYQNMLQDWMGDILAMKKAAQKQEWISRDKSFEFNDLDNHVWIEQGMLLIQDQNVTFAVEFDPSQPMPKDLQQEQENEPSSQREPSNWRVFCAITEFSETEAFMERIKNKTFDPVMDVFMEVKEGQIQWFNPAYNEVWSLDVKCSADAMEEEGLLKREFPVNIQDYEYLRVFFQKEFGYSEAEMVIRALMTNGSGFQYDPDQKTMVCRTVHFDKNIMDAMKNPKPHQPPLKSVKMLEKAPLQNLNEQWIEGLKRALEVLKNDQPTPIVLKGKTKQEDIDGAIIFYEKEILKWKNKRAKEIKEEAIFNQELNKVENKLKTKHSKKN